MGNTISEELEPNDVWWAQQTHTENFHSLPSSSATENAGNNIEIMETDFVASIDTTFENTERIAHRKVNEEKMEQFRSELAKKHLARRQAIAERSKEILFLREELAKQKKENDELREALTVKSNEVQNIETPEVEDTSWKEELDKLTTENETLKNEVARQQEHLIKYQEISQQNHDLRLNIAEVQTELQAVNSQVVAFEKERHDYQTHVAAMKEVVKVSKQLLEIRENQLQELRTKVAEIESNLAEQETSMLATNLRNEYEKQLRNMRALRTLYEQRQAATKADRDSIANELAEVTKNLETEQSKSKELQERIEELEKEVSDKYDKVQNLESQFGLVQAESRGLQAEMSVINQLFSQILVGFHNGQLDLDKLIISLEENHDLLTHIVINEESVGDISALPKTLLDLVKQVQEKNENDEEQEEQENGETLSEPLQNENIQTDQQASSSQMCSPAEIVHNLPKVWRVLAELLSQQCGQQPVAISDDGMDPCYKSIETPKGPKIVLSVSQTFIRLKDLILEKKSLEKEMTRLKQLNTHLEVRLQDQEKRLETVSTELSKTWHVVGRMQRQHQQLHTHEKILRYELAQKRKMLTELKQELEYCREKWVQAREKNSNTEEQWKKLRSEFAQRKTTPADDLNNSAESGYSDERECSSDEDSSYSSNKINKVVISSPVKNSSDTEDNDEISHGSDVDDLLESAFNKACSSGALEQPQLTLTEVYLDPDAQPSVASTSEDIDTVNIEPKTNSDCDIDIVENDTNTECTSTDNMLHSSEEIETDIEVQIENDNTQEQTNVSTNITKEMESSQNTQSFVSDTELPSTSQSIERISEEIFTSQPVQRTSEEILSKREERLRRLEEQCKQLVKKVTNTTNKGVEICTRLETLHEQYGTNTENSTQNQDNSQENDESNQDNSQENDESNQDNSQENDERNQDNSQENDESNQDNSQENDESNQDSTQREENT